MSDQQATGTRVAVIGAGAVGSTFAYTLMTSGLAREIVLIDVDHERAEGEAMDLNHGLVFAHPAHIWAGGYEDCRDAAVIVVTAGAPQKPGESRLALASRNARIVRSVMESIVAQTRDAVVIIVTNPVDVMTYCALRHSGLPWQQVFGSGTVLDSARFRYLLSEHCAVDPRNVHAYILGEHGDSEVAAWSMVHLGGVSLARLCAACHRCDFGDEQGRIARQVRDSAYHVIEAKGATYYGISQALVRIVGAVLRDERSVLTVSTLLGDYLGMGDVCLSVPCIVGRNGVVQRLLVELSDEEMDLLRRSAERVREAQDSLSPA